ncbi:MAG TPA: histidine phosphatase family protein [Candidatus Saccharimonadales bacterium]|jgi:broad specificity phosphatase PhoE|nr:histidine phosphatase family protein [Candidatus Saccharimonadales bacterium]
MGMPLDLVFVRHGQSEANILQVAEKTGEVVDLPEELRNRPDWMHRLTPHGVAQAKAAGAWILNNVGDIGDTFEARYYSSFVRARETAAHLGGAALTWRKHSMLHERDWGHFGTTPRSEQAIKFPKTTELKKAAPLYARLDGGEALADSVTLRVRDFRDTAKRKWDNKRLIAVTHGDIIGVVRYVFEDMLPEQWHEADKDPAQRIGNCAILWYTRANPVDKSDVRPYIGWRRMIQPDDLAKSPFDGQWQELPDDRFLNGQELLASVEKVPRLVPGE